MGAKKSAILAQFLTEAAVLTSLGGIVGVGAGIGMAQVINRISGVAVSISVPASAIAVVFSMLIGIIFGFLPSVQAANLDPSKLSDGSNFQKLERKCKSKLSMRGEFGISFKKFSKVKKLGIAMGRPLCYT